MKWIYALFLDENWSNTTMSESMLPELVKDLIFGSIKDISQIQEISFPTGDMARIPGYDGKLKLTDIDHFKIPSGQSVWEIKTSKDYIGESNKDFAKRSENSLGIDKKITTYVAVTSRSWGSTKKTKEKWVNEKKNEDPEWKDIRLIDANDLELWLETCPPVAANFATRVQLSPYSGVVSIEDFLRSFLNKYNPPLKKSSLLIGRENQAKSFLKEITTTKSAVLRIKADSAEEVIAFILANIELDETYRDFLKARTIIINTREAADFFSNNKNKIFIINSTIAHSYGFLALSNIVIIPTGRNDFNQKALLLARPTVYQLSNELRILGYGDEDAYKTAKECGGSLTILARRRAKIDDTPPNWVKTHFSILIPALLAGGWDEKSDKDMEMLALLSSKPSYSDYQKELLQILSLDESPIEREGSVWRLISPVDTFSYLGNLISDFHFKILSKSATMIFGEVDLKLNLEPTEDQIFVNLDSITNKYSDWLRDGIATTLLQIAVLSSELGLYISQKRPQAYVNDIIENLPGLKNDPRVILSFKRELPILMEAAPDPLLSALEILLKGKPNELAQIFIERDSIIPFSYQTPLLWALEVLAWDPSYLKRVSIILATLTKIDPGGKLSNRPINSLKEIFLLWHPNTNANIHQRFAAIDAILKVEPEISWTLINVLLPKNDGIVQITQKPKFRESGADMLEKITYGVIWQAQTELIERAINVAKGNSNRWQKLISTLPLLKSEVRKSIVHSFNEEVDTMNDDFKFNVWNFLREFINKQKSFAHKEWALKGDDLSLLDSLLKKLEPTDYKIKFKWLFDTHNPNIFPQDINLESRNDKVASLRFNAVSKIFNNLGLNGIISFSDIVSQPETLAAAFYGFVSDDNLIITAISETLGKTENQTAFASILSAETQYKKEKLSKEFSENFKLLFSNNNWNDTLKAKLLVHWPNNRNTWIFVESIGRGVVDYYWRNKQIWIDKNSAIEDVEFSAKMLNDHGRSVAAIEIIHDRANRASIVLISEILYQAISEINASHYNSMLSYYLEVIFKSLANRNDIEPSLLASLEYSYLIILEDNNLPLTIHKMMAEKPDFFMSIVKDVFKARHSLEIRNTTEHYKKAEVGFRLLRSFKRIPGEDGNEINFESLQHWINSVINLAKQEDREIITLQLIGNLLAHSKESIVDKAWPHIVVRNIIEKFDSSEMEKGIEIERFNMRGTYSKSMGEGGDQERLLSSTYYNWAEICKKWPKTNLLLQRIGKSWKLTADSEDIQGRLDR